MLVLLSSDALARGCMGILISMLQLLMVQTLVHRPAVSTAQYKFCDWTFQHLYRTAAMRPLFVAVTFAFLQYFKLVLTIGSA